MRSKGVSVCNYCVLRPAFRGTSFQVLTWPRGMLSTTYVHMTLVPMKGGRQRLEFYHCCFFVTEWNLTPIPQKRPSPPSPLACLKPLQGKVLLITSCPGKQQLLSFKNRYPLLNRNSLNKTPNWIRSKWAEMTFVMHVYWIPGTVLGNFTSIFTFIQWAMITTSQWRYYHAPQDREESEAQSGCADFSWLQD